MATSVWTWVVVVVVVFIGDVAADFQTIDSQKINIQTLSEILCNENSWKVEGIGHSSTISKLADYFRSESLPKRLLECRDKYQDSLQELNVVLNKHKDNVCGHKNIEEIWRFHWDYVVGDLGHKWSKAKSKSLPEPLMIFFMRYAQRLAERCTMNMIKRLEAAASGVVIADEPTRLAKKIAGTVDDLSMVLVREQQVTNYDTFMLLWDQILIRERKKGRVHEEAIDDVTGERVIGLIKVKDPSRAWALQRQCRHTFRPVYQNSVLPVMKLFEMGYGRVDEHSKRKVKASHDLVGKWYAMTQLCELLIPLNFYGDPSLRDGRAVILSSILETEGLEQAPNVVPLDQLPLKPSEPKVEFDDYLPIARDDQIAQLVKFNLRNRNRLFRLFFKNIAVNMKSKLKNKLKNIFVTKKTHDNRYVLESGIQIVRDSEPEVGDLTSEAEQESTTLAPPSRALSDASKNIHSKCVSNAVGLIVKIYIILIFLALAAGFIFGLVLPLLTVN